MPRHPTRSGANTLVWCSVVPTAHEGIRSHPSKCTVGPIPSVRQGSVMVTTVSCLDKSGKKVFIALDESDGARAKTLTVVGQSRAEHF